MCHYRCNNQENCSCIMHDTFYGNFVSTFNCETCKNQYSKTEKFFYLELLSNYDIPRAILDFFHHQVII